MHQGSTWLKLVVVSFFSFVFPGPGVQRDSKAHRLHGKGYTWREGSRLHGTEQGHRPCPQRRHGHELSELHLNGASGLHSQSRGHGEVEEGEGVPLWRLRA